MAAQDTAWSWTAAPAVLTATNQLPGPMATKNNGTFYVMEDCNETQLWSVPTMDVSLRLLSAADPAGGNQSCKAIRRLCICCSFSCVWVDFLPAPLLIYRRLLHFALSDLQLSNFCWMLWKSLQPRQTVSRFTRKWACPLAADHAHGCLLPSLQEKGAHTRFASSRASRALFPEPGACWAPWWDWDGCLGAPEIASQDPLTWLPRRPRCGHPGAPDMVAQELLRWLPRRTWHGCPGTWLPTQCSCRALVQ